MPEWFAIGKVRSVNPNRRELRIEPDPARIREFDAREWLGFQPRGPSGNPLRCRIAEMRNGSHELVAVLAAGVPRDTVASLKGAAVMIRFDEQHRQPGEWHPSELPGFGVMDETHGPMGTIEEVYETRAHAVAVIRGKDGGRLALPLVDEAIVRVDVENARVIVRGMSRFAAMEAPPGEPE